MKTMVLSSRNGKANVTFLNDFDALWRPSFSLYIMIVQEVINLLAERQSARLQLTQNKSKMSKMSDKERSKMVHKQQMALRKELQAVAKGIADKCISRMDSMRFIR